MIQFCKHETHGGVCVLSDTYCDMSICPYEELMEFIPARNTAKNNMCRNCYATIDSDNYNFCPYCGKELAE